MAVDAIDGMRPIIQGKARLLVSKSTTSELRAAFKNGTFNVRLSRKIRGSCQTGQTAANDCDFHEKNLLKGFELRKKILFFYQYMLFM
ncbi:hypothetical protein D1872_249700 [compost metagenome]